MIRRPPRSTRTDTLFPYTTLFRSKSGQHLDADIIITATGLKLAVAGKIPVRVDGDPVDWSQHFYYKACMFSNVPNFAVVFGYLNASWTLRADIVAEYVCRVLNHMRDSNAEVATRSEERRVGKECVSTC